MDIENVPASPQEAPDTDELLLRDIERCMTHARAAFDAEQWEDASVHIGFASVQADRLVGYLRARIASLNVPPCGVFL
jgi:hypothetical protein